MTHFPGKSVTEKIYHKTDLDDQQNPMVSVIIPSYNHAHFVGDAIRSVLNQEYDRFEIILVDDGSTDNTGEVVAQFGFRVRYTYQPNQGLSAARNKGLRLARGELIGFLDADDLYEPDYLGTLVSLLKTNPHADGVHCACRFVDMYNQPLPQFAGRCVPPDKLYPNLLQGNFMTPNCMLIYRRCYQKVGGFDTSLSSCEDWDMWLRISRVFNIISTNRVLVRYRVYPSSMSTVVERMLLNRLAVLKKNIGKECSEITSLTDDELEAFARCYLTASIEYLQTGANEQAYQCLHRALDIYPTILQYQDIFYELAWGATPRGYRGDFGSLNLSHNKKVLAGMLDRVFPDARISIQLKPYRNKAYANFYLVLSQLSYGKEQFHQSREYWFRAAMMDLSPAFSKPYLLTLFKIIIGVKSINSIKRWKRRQMDQDLINLEKTGSFLK
jgi:glycosyltransferase involved in cell wall biosynthesis